MEITVLETLVTLPVPRDIEVPWLEPNTTKVQLYQDFVFRVICEKRNINVIIVIPKGYVSDWSTIPRFLWVFYPPSFAEARKGAVAHDYIYSHLHHHFSKDFADALLKAFMAKDGANRFDQTLFHLSVKMGGKGGWHYRTLPNAHPHWKTHHELIPYDTGRSFFDEAVITTRRSGAVERSDC